MGRISDTRTVNSSMEGVFGIVYQQPRGLQVLEPSL